MRTEDFVMSSTKNPNLQLIDTTVVKITSQSKNMVVITLSYNNNNKVIITNQLSTTIRINDIHFILCSNVQMLFLNSVNPNPFQQWGAYIPTKLNK